MQVVAAPGGRERRRAPGVERFRRLHVVVPIDKKRRPAGRAQPVGVDDGMAGGRNDLHVLEADLEQMTGEPARAGAHVGGVPWLPADRRKADEIAQLGNNPAVLGSNIGNGILMLHRSEVPTASDAEADQRCLGAEREDQNDAPTI